MDGEDVSGHQRESHWRENNDGDFNGTDITFCQFWAPWRAKGGTHPHARKT
jgi:hypothetical protein